jgi:hypothetical protein
MLKDRQFVVVDVNKLISRKRAGPKDKIIEVTKENYESIKKKELSMISNVLSEQCEVYKN